MIYEFEDPNGQIIEISFSMACAPVIGSIISHNGMDLRRVVSASVQVDPGTCRGQYPYVSHSLPRGLDGCKVTRDNKPIVMSKRHERNIMAQHGYAKD